SNSVGISSLIYTLTTSALVCIILLEMYMFIQAILYIFKLAFIIEELIQQFNPTMIIVEHDKAFQQTVATKTISM
ncbi:hypothetical protein Q8G37_16240, partial [Bacillus wiedmannii]|nr:hypothetical protein [Bacillus wiedmannii]